MRTILLTVVALLAAGAVGWLVLGGSPSASVPPAGPGAGPGAGAGGPSPEEDGGGIPGPDGAGRPGPGEKPVAPVPPPEEPWKTEVDGVPPRPPEPLGPGGVGEATRWEEMDEEDRAKAEKLMERLHETRTGKVHYRSRALESVLRDLSARHEVAFELASEDLEDEPVELALEDQPLFELVHQICLARHLRFEVHPDKVVILR